jgi:uncharacterized membrane protein
MSSRALRITMLVLTLIGLGIATYLTIIHYAGIKPVCSAGGSCEKVQTSAYSTLAGVPVALMGLIGYLAILISLLLPEDERTRFATVAITVPGFGFSAYLTYRELFSIHAICEWCATSAGIMTILVCLSIWRFLRGDVGSAAAAGPSAVPASAQDAQAPLGSIST